MFDLLGWTANIGLQVYFLDQLLKSAGRERYSSLRAIEITPLLANGILKIFSVKSTAAYASSAFPQVHGDVYHDGMRLPLFLRFSPKHRID
jgi:hypothetical protein